MRGLGVVDSGVGGYEVDVAGLLVGGFEEGCLAGEGGDVRLDEGRCRGLGFERLGWRGGGCRGDRGRGGVSLR